MARHAVVVGGGAIGLSCARSLTRSGFDVTVVDRDRLGAGCSSANCGLIVPSHSLPVPGPGVIREGLGYLARRDSPFAIRPSIRLAPWLLAFWRACDADTYRLGSEHLVALSRAGLDRFEELARELEFGFRRGPLLHAYRSEDGLARSNAELRELDSLGITARGLSRDELLSMEPALSPSFLGGIAIEDQGWADPHAFLRALAKDQERRGRILEGTPVRRIAARNGQASAVETTGGTIEADVIVLTAGAWTASLTEPLGLRIPIQPAAGYSCTITAPSNGPNVPVVLPERRVVLTPLPGRLRFGGTLELSGFRTAIDRARYGAVVRAGLGALSASVPRSAEEPWFGLRPLTSDGLPVIGWVPRIDGVLIAAGHGMLGFTQAPITGDLVADLATGRRPSLSIDPFRPERFSTR
jgi:D-amino-acid dehydrogenase